MTKTFGFPAFTRPGFQLLHFPDGDGGGMENQGGAGGEGGAGGGAGGGEAQAYEFKDENQRFKFPGMDKPMTVKEYRDGFLPKSQVEGTMKLAGQMADLIRNAQQRKPQQGKQAAPAQQQQAQDILAALEANEMPDGKAIASILRQYQGQNIQPLMQAVLQMAKELREVKGHVGNFRQERAETGFTGNLQGAISSLGLPQTAEPIQGSEALQEMARDFFFSFDDQDHPKLAGGEFNKLFKERFTQARTFFRNLEKAELGAAQERARKMRFTRPGSGTGAGGAGKPTVRTNRQSAEALFATSSPT